VFLKILKMLNSAPQVLQQINNRVITKFLNAYKWFIEKNKVFVHKNYNYNKIIGDVLKM